jgi:TRAP-type mannitol/chloroaromatic compound transport system permease small subunit
VPQFLTMQQRFHAWLSDNPGEAILRWIFRSVVTVTIAVLAVDLISMNGWIANPDAAATPAEL